MRTCSQKNIEENSWRTEAGFHPECEPTYIDAQSSLAFVSRPENPSWIDRPNSIRPILLTFKADGYQLHLPHAGVVGYSGNDVKSYGNLVLVRHSNGYVTAYAHASEVLVKRGDAIKRGQIIAKSGQSGEVGSPQLHFEIRKGTSPVDPLQFLNGA